MVNIKVEQRGDKSVFIEENTGEISIHTNGEVRIINQTSPEDRKWLEEVFGAKANDIILKITELLSGRQHPRYLTTSPFNTEYFIGRQKDLDSIEADYQQHKRLLVLINGEGGIGKTTLVSKYWYAHEGRYKHLAWLYAERGIDNALVTLKSILDVEFMPTDTLDEQVQRIAHAISNLDAPCLLVLDNANDAADLKKHYGVLNRLVNCDILLTSRVRQVANMRVLAVQPLTEAEAIQLFGTHYPDVDEVELPLLHDILRAVGYNTLVTEVLAKNMAAFNRFTVRYTLADLLRDLQEKGLLALKNKTVAVMYGSDTLREAAPTDIIAAMYDLTRLSDAERYMLSNLAVLPAESISCDFISKSIIPLNNERSIWEKLKTYFTDKKELTITVEEVESLMESLEIKGWIEYRKADLRFRISPVVQAVTKNKNAHRLSDDCNTLVNTLSTGLAPATIHKDNYNQASVFARFGEAVIYALPLPDDKLSVLCQNIGIYYQHTGNLSGMKEAYLKMLNILTALCEAEPENSYFKMGKGWSNQFLGITYTDSGDLDSALAHFIEMLQIFYALHIAYPRKVEFKNGLAISYSKLGETYFSAGDLPRALLCFEHYKSLEEALHKAYPKDIEFIKQLAISYEKLGVVYKKLGNFLKALTFFECETRLFEVLHEAEPLNVGYKNGLAISYEKLGETLFDLDDFEKALILFEERSRLGEELHIAYPKNVEFKNGLAISYSKLGQTHSALDSLPRALTFFEKYSILEKSLHEANPEHVEYKNGLALSYQFLGVCYMDLDNLAHASTFIEQSNKLAKSLHEDYPKNMEFKKNLAISYEKRGQCYRALDDLSQALTFFKAGTQLFEELYESYPKDVDFQLGLAISYSNLASIYLRIDLAKAREYFCGAEKHILDLVSVSPKNSKFQHYLNIVRKEISKLV